MNVFVANVGLRDLLLYLDDAWLYLSDTRPVSDDILRRRIDLVLGCKPTFRDRGRSLLGDLGQPEPDPTRPWRTDDSVRLPILKPALDCALDEIEQSGGQLDAVYLFGTDQSDPHHRQRDTYHVAELVSAHLLRRLFPDHVTHAARAVASNINPASTEDAYRFFAGFFEARQVERTIPVGARVYASVRGGTPQMNAALQSHVLDRFGKDATLIEVDEPPVADVRQSGASGDAWIVDTWLPRRTALMRVAEPLIERHEYHAVLGLLSRELTDAELTAAGTVGNLLAHADARLNLSWTDAFYRLDDPAFPETHALRVDLGDAHSPQRLRDIADSALLLAERHDHVGFLARVTMFDDVCRRQLVWHLAGVDLLSPSGRNGQLLKDLRPDELRAGAARRQQLLRAEFDLAAAANERLGTRAVDLATERARWRIDRGFTDAVIEGSINGVQRNEVGTAARRLTSILRRREPQPANFSWYIELRNRAEHFGSSEVLPEARITSFATLASETIDAMQGLLAAIGTPRAQVVNQLAMVEADVLARLAALQPEESQATVT